MEQQEEVTRVIKRIREHTVSNMRNLTNLLKQINSASRSAQYIPKEALLLLKFIHPIIEMAKASAETSLGDIRTLERILSGKK